MFLELLGVNPVSRCALSANRRHYELVPDFPLYAYPGTHREDSSEYRLVVRRCLRIADTATAEPVLQNVLPGVTSLIILIPLGVNSNT